MHTGHSSQRSSPRSGHPRLASLLHVESLWGNTQSVEMGNSLTAIEDLFSKKLVHYSKAEMPLAMV